MNALIPIPKADVTVRDATLADVAFIDQLQKMHNEQVGFMRTSWIEEKIARGEVLIAEEKTSADVADDADENKGKLHLNLRPSAQSADHRLGYVMGVDRYFKRDDLGIIHQLNVVPGKQRGFVGATLLKAMFDRAAYGCRMFCCWCAQDIEANRFWEAMGFVPLAFRAGSEKKKGGRVHIFWQKRIREGDVTTPWWFPAKTDAGVMRADRLVFPIPRGRHWSEEMPILIPAKPQAALEPPLAVLQRAPQRVPGTKCDPQPPTPKPRAKVQFGPPVAKPVVVETEKPKPEPKKKTKCDPKLVAVARELRDRWLEHVNEGELLLEAVGKYDATRALPDVTMPPRHLLPAAA